MPVVALTAFTGAVFGWVPRGLSRTTFEGSAACGAACRSVASVNFATCDSSALACTDKDCAVDLSSSVWAAFCCVTLFHLGDRLENDAAAKHRIRYEGAAPPRTPYPSADFIDLSTEKARKGAFWKEMILRRYPKVRKSLGGD